MRAHITEYYALNAMFESFLSHLHPNKLVRFWREATFWPFSAHNLGQLVYPTPYDDGPLLRPPEGTGSPGRR